MLVGLSTAKNVAKGMVDIFAEEHNSLSDKGAACWCTAGDGAVQHRSITPQPTSFNVMGQ